MKEGLLLVMPFALALIGCNMNGNGIEETTDEDKIEDYAIADTAEYEAFTDDGVPIRKQSSDKEAYFHHYYDPRDGKWKLFAFDADTTKMSKKELSKIDTIITKDDFDNE